MWRSYQPASFGPRSAASSRVCAECNKAILVQPRIAVILPCFNEAGSIGQTVAAFKKVLPEATIYVFDNLSTDATVEEATKSGAVVCHVLSRGKGHVFRQAFAQIEADVYMVADGDNTYDANSAPDLVSTLWSRNLDMVVGVRHPLENTTAYPHGHLLGNRLLNWVFGLLFRKAFSDIFSGYRALSRPFVKSFPALADGFETETEMSLHAIQLGLPFSEVSTLYRPRHRDTSKLRTYRDGVRIVWFFIRLLRQLHPLFTFMLIGSAAAVASLALGAGVLLEFLETGLVPRLPTALLAASLMIIAFTCVTTGLVLDGVAHAQKELKRLIYLSIPRDAL